MTVPVTGRLRDITDFDVHIHSIRRELTLCRVPIDHARTRGEQAGPSERPASRGFLPSVRRWQWRTSPAWKQAGHKPASLK